MLTTAADAQTLRSRWGWIFGAGVVLAILGVVALMNIVSATVITASIIGLVLIVAGIVDVFAAFAGGTETGGWRLLRGVLGVIYILLGFYMFANPVSGAITLTVAVGLLLIFEGIMRMVTSFVIRDRLLLGFAIGILDIVLGLWAITNIPFSVTTIGFFVGFMLIFGGISWMVAGWSLKSGAFE